MNSWQLIHFIQSPTLNGFTSGLADYAICFYFAGAALLSSAGISSTRGNNRHSKTIFLVLARLRLFASRKPGCPK